MLNGLSLYGSNIIRASSTPMILIKPLSLHCLVPPTGRFAKHWCWIMHKQAHPCRRRFLVLSYCDPPPIPVSVSCHRLQAPTRHYDMCASCRICPASPVQFFYKKSQIGCCVLCVWKGRCRLGQQVHRKQQEICSRHSLNWIKMALFVPTCQSSP